MSVTSSHFPTESLFTTSSQLDNSNYTNPENNCTTATECTIATTDDSPDDNDNDDLDYFIPSMEEFCMHTTALYTPRHGTMYLTSHGDEVDKNTSANDINQQFGNLFCTPRSIFTIQSIGSEIDNIPIALKRNIWAEGSSTMGLNLNQEEGQELVWQLQKEQELISLQQQQFQFSMQLQQEQQRQKSQQLDLFTKQYYSYAAMDQCNNVHPSLGSETVISNRLHLLDSPLIGKDYATIAPPKINPPQCLTFRTYSGSIFTVPSKSRFFVIKSYNILDVNASFEHKIWTSTELGNKRLDKAFHELQITGNPDSDGKIFLFFSVNSSGKFCGVSQMKECIDYNKTSDIWCEQTRWKGIFPVEWLLIKDVPNKFFQHLKVPANEFKPVTNSRDTQEIPFDTSISMLKIISSFKNNE
ncbi:hypothetical protein CANMA_002704 [Candida margitis]|uniref:uncharacterized protein n=1 Tax=Candida margitis TaxID=1775924 RepID=UPI0022270754|nr:uncharacterized protein CANMA_002704 [Candida margitis]KAI5967936.1 hypothetical protein CANMA_002704 [Candida margitis]